MLHRALPPALCSLVLLVSHAVAVPYDFKDNYKPSPAEANRDRAHFIYDIVGVVGGYVFTVLIWGVLLLTIGRTMRRKALAPPKELELELQEKTSLTLKTPGPTSPPLSSRSWLRKFKKTDSAVQSPVVQSPSSFDQNVLDRQREQAQADMERLYAAVMDHDAQKHYSKVSVDETDPNSRRPSAQDESPVSPIKAIYPPGYHPAPGAVPPRLHDQDPPASPRSILSKRSQVSTQSTATSKNARFNLKNLRIAGPAQKYPGAGAADDDARTPLSPNFQPALPSPPSQPASPYDPDEELDQVQPLPRPAPQRAGSATSTSTPNATAPTNQSLPLRSFAEPLRSPGIQTTVLDRRVGQLSLTTPKTGVPFTPYSPYMPFTPITPVTPHLVSKRDRKMLAKIEGRRKAATREDVVQTPKEIFGDAY